jgi:hypothetical protein
MGRVEAAAVDGRHHRARPGETRVDEPDGPRCVRYGAPDRAVRQLDHRVGRKAPSVHHVAGHHPARARTGRTHHDHHLRVSPAQLLPVAHPPRQHRPKFRAGERPDPGHRIDDRHHGQASQGHAAEGLPGDAGHLRRDVGRPQVHASCQHGGEPRQRAAAAHVHGGPRRLAHVERRHRAQEGDEGRRAHDAHGRVRVCRPRPGQQQPGQAHQTISPPSAAHAL